MKGFVVSSFLLGLLFLVGGILTADIRWFVKFCVIGGIGICVAVFLTLFVDEE